LELEKKKGKPLTKGAQAEKSGLVTKLLSLWAHGQLSATLCQQLALPSCLGWSPAGGIDTDGICWQLGRGQWQLPQRLHGNTLQEHARTMR
jgi:hypothetical protein